MNYKKSPLTSVPPPLLLKPNLNAMDEWKCFKVYWAPLGWEPLTAAAPLKSPSGPARWV